MRPLFRPLAVVVFGWMGLSLAIPLAGRAGVLALFDSKQVWTDENGESHVISEWKQGPLVLTMIYGDCRKTCPNLTFVKLREIQKALDERKIAASFVIGTFDPKNDTNSVLQHLKTTNAKNRTNWHFIRGNPEQTRALAQELGLGGFYEMDEHIVHKFRIVYFDPTSKRETALDYDHKDVQWLFKP